MAFTYDNDANLFGDPQHYKKIKIYPLKLRDYNKYSKYLNILSFYHVKIEEANISQMSFLQFLLILFLENEVITLRKAKVFDKEAIKKHIEGLAYLHLLFDKSKDNVAFKPFMSNFTSIATECQSYRDFIGFLALILHKSTEEFSLEFTMTRMGIVQVFLKIGDAIFGEQDFEDIRQIILQQNGIDFEYVRAYNPELEAKMEVLYHTTTKNQATFEEQVLTFCLIIQKNPQEIADYTYYQFMKMYERHAILFNFTLFKPLESAGLIKLEHGEINHYLSRIERKGRYDDLYIDKDSFTKNTLSKIAKEGKI